MSWDAPPNGGSGWGAGGGAAVEDVNEPANKSSGGANESNAEVMAYVGGSDAFGNAGEGYGEAGAGGVGGGRPGGCFNCGEEGHNKVDCSNPAIPREFTGTCRVCEQQGHRASDCPSAPPKICKNCAQEGHEVVECENPRKIDRSHIPNVSPEDAWKELLAAVEDRDMNDVKEAAAKYIKGNPELTYASLEQGFRNCNIGVYLVAIEKELAKTYTNMDLQGNMKKTYTVTWRFSPKPQRPKDSEGWPETPEANVERLADAGTPVDCLMPLCSNCEELGHMKKNCPVDANEPAERAEVKCYNCDGIGHRVRDCPNERPDRFACRNCKKSGHDSKECPEPRSAEGVECKKCNEIGHFSKDCPTAPKIPCYNCGEFGHRKAECTSEKQLLCRNCDGIGHLSKECPKPRDYSRIECQNCKQKGHTKVRCPNPVAEEAEDNGGGYSGGDSGNAGYGAEVAIDGDNLGGGDDAIAAGGNDSWGGGGGDQAGW